MGVAPWDLAERPFYYQRWAQACLSVENRVRKMKEDPQGDGKGGEGSGKGSGGKRSLLD